MPRLRLRARPSLPVALLISFASGLALSLAFPPAGWWPLAFAGLIPLLWLLRTCGPGRGFLLGTAFGLSLYGSTIYWIWRFGSAAWIGLSIEMALWIGVFGLLRTAIQWPGRPILDALGAAALWTVLEWFRGLWPFGGFSWGTLGISQVDNHVTLRLAAVAGVWGISFAVVLVSALIVVALSDRTTPHRRWLAVGLALIAVLAPVAIPFGSPNGPEVDVATI